MTMTTAFTLAQHAFIMERTARAKREILESVVLAEPIAARKLIPLNLASFGDLHGYCDANCLANLCDDDDNVSGQALFPPTGPNDEPGSMSEAFQDAVNQIQGNVHLWIETGGMRRQAARIACLDNEQVACFLNEERVEEARGMLDDLKARVLGRAPNFSAEDLSVLQYLHHVELHPAAPKEEASK